MRPYACGAHRTSEIIGGNQVVDAFLRRIGKGPVPGQEDAAHRIAPRSLTGGNKPMSNLSINTKKSSTTSFPEEGLLLSAERRKNLAPEIS